MSHKNYKDVDEINGLQASQQSQSNSQGDNNPTSTANAAPHALKSENIERLLLEEREKNKSKIPYMFTCCVDMPGKFLLSYMIKTRLRNEYIKLTHEGFTFRQKMFSSFNELISWFKQHFMDPLPVRPPPQQQQQQQQTASHDRISSQMSNVSIQQRNQNYPPNSGNGAFDSLVNNKYGGKGTDHDSRHQHGRQPMDYDARTGSNNRENGGDYRSRHDSHRSGSSHRPLAASNSNEFSSFNQQQAEQSQQRPRRSRFTDNTDVVSAPVPVSFDISQLFHG